MKTNSCWLLISPQESLFMVMETKNNTTLDNIIAGYYQSTNQNHRVLHVHRLDKETSGCILYCQAIISDFLILIIVWPTI
ncbi:MAG: hypothetical protein ACOX1L_09190 [Erysipelotrichaceae bacterium]